MYQLIRTNPNGYQELMYHHSIKKTVVSYLKLVVIDNPKLKIKVIRKANKELRGAQHSENGKVWKYEIKEQNSENN